MGMATGDAGAAYSEAFAPRRERRGVFIQNIEATDVAEQLVVAIAPSAATAPATGFLLQSINCNPATDAAPNLPLFIPTDLGVYVKRQGASDVEWVGLDT